MFSERVLKLLYKSGWTEQYSVDVSEYIRILNEEGFFPGEIIVQFLRRFGNIKVLDTHPVLKSEHMYFSIDPENAHERRPAFFYKKVRNLIGEEIYPVGDAGMEPMLLLMSESGRFYGNYESALFYFGASVEEAFDYMCRDSSEFKDVQIII